MSSEQKRREGQQLPPRHERHSGTGLGQRHRRGRQNDGFSRPIVWLAAVATVAVIIAVVVAVVCIDYSRRRDRLWMKWNRSRQRHDEIHFVSPLSKEFCSEVMALLPPEMLDGTLDLSKHCARLAESAFLRSAFEWMAGRVGKHISRRLYWIDAWCLTPCVPLSFVQLDSAPGCWCYLVIEPNAGRATVTTCRVAAIEPWRKNATCLLVIMSTLPRFYSEQKIASVLPGGGRRFPSYCAENRNVSTQ